MDRLKNFGVRVNKQGTRFWAPIQAVSGRQAIAIARAQGLIPYGVKKF